LYLKIDKPTKKIKDIKFETLGCAAAIAASDMICELAKGKTLDKALKISFKDISKSLGILPPLKIHCAQLVTEALRKAIEKYKRKK
jgi:nitrogen fixation NifU-like protein